MSSEPKKAVEKKPEDSKPTNDKPAEKPTATKPAPKKVPPKEEPELPAFEKGIADKIIENFGEKTTISFVKPDRVGIKVGRDAVHDVAEFARDVLNYDHVDSVSGVDYPADKEIEVVYHLSSYTDPTLTRQILELATRAQREDKPIPGNDATKLPSLRDIFYSVEFHEREVFEMLGVFFEGHPDNRRLLLPEDWADLPPLRKDFRNKGR
jgi:NADH-quinone oxidoreductase subunit C